MRRSFLRSAPAWLGAMTAFLLACGDEAGVANDPVPDEGRDVGPRVVLQDGATGVSVLATLELPGDGPLLPESVNERTVTLEWANLTGPDRVPADVSYDAESNRIVVRPNVPLTWDTTYRLVQSGVRGAGGVLTARRERTFRTFVNPLRRSEGGGGWIAERWRYEDGLAVEVWRDEGTPYPRHAVLERSADGTRVSQVFDDGKRDDAYRGPRGELLLSMTDVWDGEDGVPFTGDDRAFHCTSYEYDGFGDLLRRHDRGWITRDACATPEPQEHAEKYDAYLYDEAGWLWATITHWANDADGEWFGWNDPIDGYERFDRDALGRLTRVERAVGRGADGNWLVGEDDRTFSLEWSYDERTGLPSRVVKYAEDPADAPVAKWETRFEYDAAGNRTREETREFYETGPQEWESGVTVLERTYETGF